MKRLIALILILAIFASFTACNPKPEPILQPINFYYLNKEITYGSSNGLISAEIVDSAHYNGSILATLNAYVRGPGQDRHRRTFPSGTQIYQVDVVDGKAYIQLNNTFGRLSGIDLTIACACLTMTTMELTGAQSVTISTQNVSLDGNPSITMDADSILFFSNTDLTE